MGRERTLLERLLDPEAEGARTIHENTGRLADSVLANLRHMLNSRQGSAPFDAEYGIPDLADIVHSFPDAIAGMRKAIKTAIERYEPRLRRVVVRPVETADDPLALHFEITGELVTEGEKASLWVETRIDSTGRVELKG
jgi:type VI secretion system protein